MENPSQYIPGVCNIGPAEIRRRKAIGWSALIVTILVWAILDYFGAAAGWFLLLFFPAAMAATGFIQGFSHFCAGFGMKGLFNFSSETGKTDSVSQAEFRAKDLKKARAIFAWSIIIGVIIALGGFFLR